MRAIQLTNRGQITNPFIDSRVNHPVAFNVKEEVGVRVYAKKVQSKVNRNTSTTSSENVFSNIDDQPNHPFFKDKAFADMTMGLIPNFEQLYQRYLEIEPKDGELLPAINFLPALREFVLTKEEIDVLLNNPEPEHILVQNDQVKIILIRWEQGKLSSIHGHAIGGGLVKVLHGEIEEKRYTADSEQRLLSKSTYLADHISYIDDVMGLHSVGNNRDSLALTMHICTPGKYKVKEY